MNRIRIGMAAALLLAAAWAAGACARIPRERELLRAARESAPGDAVIVAYDEQARQATLEIRQVDPASGTTNAVFRWFTFDGKTWRAMPMTAVRAPVRPASAGTPTNAP